MVVRSMVAAGGEIGGCFGTGSMEDIDGWRLKIEKRRRYVYGYWWIKRKSWVCFRLKGVGFALD